MANNLPTIKPSLNLQFANTNAIPPDVTFTRASTSGGYYDGRTVSKAEENLILQSQTFGTSWILDNATVSSNTATAPDGTVTADTVVESATTSSHLIRQATIPLTVATYVASVYAKASTRSMLSMGFDGSNAWFNLSTGAVGTVEAGLTASISDAGSGWYRCSVTRSVVVANAKTFGLYVATTDNVLSYAGDGTSGIFVWGAQLEQRSSVTAYTPTTTQQITNYIPKMLFAATNVPVIDHNPTTGERLGLAIWEARTNLLTYSEDFSNAAWTKTAATATTNQIIAPDGTLTVDNFIPNSGSAAGSSILERTVTAAAAAYTESIFVKGAGFNSVILNFRDNASVSNQASVTFDISAATISTAASVQGSFTSPVATITDVGNGWRRISLTCTTTGATAFRVRLWQAVSAGDGYSGIYIWGAQLEAGAFATPYIPTVASTVARSADVAVMTGVNFSRWYRQDEGSFVAEAAHIAVTGFPTIVAASQATSSNDQMLLYTTTTGLTGESFFVRTGGVIQADIRSGAVVASGVSFKVSGAYKVNDFATSLNGASVVTDTSGILPANERLTIGASNTSALYLNGYIKSLSYYPIALTSAQLQAVTA